MHCARVLGVGSLSQGKTSNSSSIRWRRLEAEPQVRTATHTGIHGSRVEAGPEQGCPRPGAAKVMMTGANGTFVYYYYMPCSPLSFFFFRCLWCLNGKQAGNPPRPHPAQGVCGDFYTLQGVQGILILFAALLFISNKLLLI